MFAVVFGCALGMSAHRLEAEETRGARIYADKCAACHGANGAGTAEYPDPLIGDRSLRELTDLISRTMPEGEPEECIGEDALQVAQFIYDAFYSKFAQDRNRPATIEFSRLTVRQYEHAVTDLLGSFSWNGAWNEERGLKAEYFIDRRFRGNQRVIERIDPVVSFDFGEGAPEGFPDVSEEEQNALYAEQIRVRSKEPLPRAYSIRWEGSFLAPETGDYEFIVETPNALRLWVNDLSKPLIDAAVQSGSDVDHRQRLRLLGGRVYSIKLEVFRYRESTGFVRLKWKVPHHAESLIPERALSPHRWPTAFVLSTPFPPDDRSIGYERGSAISKEWSEATTYAALEVAAYVTDNLPRLANLGNNDSGQRGTRRRSREERGAHPMDEQEQKVREFCRLFVTRAFRRPLSEAEQHVFIDKQFEGTETLEEAVKRVVLLTLKSPRFLYREAGLGQFDDYAVASWISFTLWDSIPDQQLLDAAGKGELSTKEHIERQAERMIGNLKTRAKLREFLHQWLQVDHFPDISKSPDLFPGFDGHAVSDLRISLNLFLDDVLWSDASDFRQLLLADWLYLNGRLAKIYGVDLPEDADFQKVSLVKEGRAGVLSHPLLMAGFAYDRSSSPVHRGVFLSRAILGRRLKPPPIAVAPLSPDLHENLTTRERVKLQTSPAMCQSCHMMIDPLGFSLENFDAIGRFRKQEKERPIDAQGQYLDRSGELATFTGSRELAAFLALTPETHAAFTEFLFQYTVKQPVRAFGENRLEELRNSFVSQEFSVKKLLREVVVSSVLTAREIEKKATVSLEENVKGNTHPR